MGAAIADISLGAGIADDSLRRAIQTDMATVRTTPATRMLQEQRVSGDDAIGSAAAYTRRHVCQWMRTEAGQAKWLPSFKLASRDVNDWPSIASRVPVYQRAVEGMATNDFAGHQTLVELAERLRLRIQVVPSGTTDPMPMTIDPTDQDPANPVPQERTIVLGNNDVHYVWLAQDHQLGPQPHDSEAQEHEATHSADAEDHEMDLRGDDALCARIRPVFAPGVDHVACRANLDSLFNGHSDP